jgi:hypothetical protein
VLSLTCPPGFPHQGDRYGRSRVDPGGGAGAGRDGGAGVTYPYVAAPPTRRGPESCTPQNGDFVPPVSRRKYTRWVGSWPVCLDVEEGGALPVRARKGACLEFHAVG